MTTTTASWYHCSVQTISRSANRTAVAAAAYRTATRLSNQELKKSPGIGAAAYATGTRLNDEQSPDQEVTDYTRKRGVATWFIVVPDNAPSWAYDLERLWNEAQAKDSRINSRIARECVLALPGALDAEEREQIARDFAEHLVDRYGVAVTVALHAPSRNGDDRNWHAHVLFTTRRMDENGLGKKTRELDDKVTGPKEITHIRKAAADIINLHLEKAGIDERVDHRSYKARGIDREATVHMGVEASALERRGEKSEMGDKNRKAQEHNRKLEEYDHNIENYTHEYDELVSELAALDAEISQELEKEFSEIETEPEEENKNPHFIEEAEAIVSLSWEEQKRQAQDPFACEIMQEFERQIEEGGEIREYGLGQNWYDRTVVFFENLYYAAVNKAKDIWRYVSGRDSTRDRDDLER